MTQRAMRTIEVTFTRMARSHSSRSTSTAVPGGPPMPTLLIRTSTRPQRRTVSATAARQASGSVTSVSRTNAAPPSRSTISRVSSAHSLTVSSMATRAPARASTTEVARPFPMPPGAREPAPVTIATRPAIRPAGSSLLARRSTSAVSAVPVRLSRPRGPLRRRGRPSGSASGRRPDQHLGRLGSRRRLDRDDLPPRRHGHVDRIARPRQRRQRDPAELAARPRVDGHGEDPPRLRLGGLVAPVDRVLLHDPTVDQDGSARPDRDVDRVRRPGVDVLGLALPAGADGRTVELLILLPGDRHPLDRGTGALQDGRQEVVRERTGRRHAAQPRRDGGRFGGPHPQRQEAPAGPLAEEQDVLAGRLVHPD